MLEHIDLKHARDALHAIDPACSRENWHSIGRAAIAAGLTIDDLDEWSRSAANYSGERDVKAAFRTIAPTGGTGPGTLWKAALSAGWRPPKDKDDAPKARGGSKPPRKPPARPAAAPQRQCPGMDAAEVWARCEAATAAHRYIEAKQGRPDGLRVVPAGDPLRIAGASVVGWLVVPVVPLAGGVPASLLFIPPPDTGKKLNLPGAPMVGVFIVGDVLAGGSVYVCEGIGQAWACWEATGAAAVVCFGWGNVRKVAAELRQRDPSARLVLVPDVGKEAEAETIAREVAAQFVTMPEGWPANADANDLAQRDGFDALEALLLAPQAPAQRFRLLGSSDLHALPPLTWRVRGVLPAHGLASVYGPSGSGKSFLVLDAAAAIADGADWFGYRVKP